MGQKRLVITGTGSGVGKTTITIGIMCALKKKGLQVQGFKCGPDYIDPSYHTAVTGRQSRNLDSWMLNHETVKDILKVASENSDISIIEGVMGFYDGKSPTSDIGSTAEISLVTESPVLLVVNCASMARSVAAIVKGFQTLNEKVRIVGVIANRVGSVGHYKLVKAAIEQECQIPVVGYLQKNDQLSIPERHLGLIPSIERGELDDFFEQLASYIEESIDLDQILSLAEASELTIDNDSSVFKRKQQPPVRIAVAKDAAFNFYYEENFRLLENYGVKLHYFSPLKGEKLPDDIDGLYIGGGFPEEFASELAAKTDVKLSIKTAIDQGLPTLAECGGFMYLTEQLKTTDGQVFPMVGVISGGVEMQTKRAALGYREVSGLDGNYLLPNGLKARGHEFHYSTFHPKVDLQAAYETKGMRGVKQEGVIEKKVVAGYTHLHFASCPELVQNWYEECLRFQRSKRRN
ncbi:cobyrinic acid a,c-diamide synthase [Oikeobacillus pervagus]|uniref:Cobyrinate a,c-diamide synthase n=1 Tax=Oikeobacillus pervagus TaxID=1325931 RepID=A0AAJ1SWU8_9BACI|nr:cobyrinate a,c-diamide synthase [Oikeobacillus pervagus]MDQ0214225.1 cobyrinic acid a,c-diamide synthase [Oikeobacillus pervagus]